MGADPNGEFSTSGQRASVLGARPKPRNIYFKGESSPGKCKDDSSPDDSDDDNADSDSDRSGGGGGGGYFVRSSSGKSQGTAHVIFRWISL